MIGALASSALANELHRRLPFAVGGRVIWQTARWEGGLLAVVGMVLSGLALAWWQTVAGKGSAVADVAVIAVVTGVVGLVRFATLRWLFDRSTRRVSDVGPNPAVIARRSA